MKHIIYDRYPIGNKRFVWKQKDYVLSTFAGVPMRDYAVGDINTVADKSVKNLKEAKNVIGFRNVEDIEVLKEYKLSIDKKKIVMDTIKVSGTYEIEVKLYPEVSTKMKVVIIPQ